MKTITKTRTFTNKLAAGVSALSLLAGVSMAAAPAQAGTLYGSVGISGTASVTNSVNQPWLTFTPDAINPTEFTGQFAGGTLVGPGNGTLKKFQLARVGNTNDYNLLNDVTDFFQIQRSAAQGGGIVKVDLLAATPAFRRIGNNQNFQFQIIDFLAVNFIEPDNTVIEGTLALNLSKSGNSTTFQLTADKPTKTVPEPSALLGLGALGAFAFSTGLKRKKLVQA